MMKRDENNAISIRTAVRQKVVPIHRFSMWYYLGGLALLAFAIQFVTGVLLLYYFEASAGLTTKSLAMIVRHVPFGWFVRSLHAWSGSIAILLTAAHMFAAYFLKSYRASGRSLWSTGVPMIAIVLGFGYTGSQLPWLQGSDLRTAYALHVAVLPLITVGLLGLHLTLSVLHSASAPSGVEVRRYRSFLADYLFGEAIVWLIALAIIILVAWFLPWEFNGSGFAPAGAFQLSIPDRWYLLWQQGWVDRIPLTLYWLSIVIVLAGLYALPRRMNAAGHQKLSKLYNTAGVAVIGLLIALFILAYFSSPR